MTPLSVAVQLGRMSRFKAPPPKPAPVPLPEPVVEEPPPLITFENKGRRKPLRYFVTNERGESRPSVGLVKYEVATAYDVTFALLESPDRTQAAVLPRQVYFYLAKKLTFGTLEDIRSRAGNRDHTTLLHGIRKIAAKIDSDFFFADEVALIEAKILAASDAALKGVYFNAHS